jgi:hypothetical protein
MVFVSAALLCSCSVLGFLILLMDYLEKREAIKERKKNK